MQHIAKADGNKLSGMRQHRLGRILSLTDPRRGIDADAHVGVKYTRMRRGVIGQRYAELLAVRTENRGDRQNLTGFGIAIFPWREVQTQRDTSKISREFDRLQHGIHGAVRRR